MYIRSEWFGIINGQISSVVFTELSSHISIFSFPDDSLSRCQSIFSKFGMCIDIMEIWFGIASGQISSICPPQDSGEVLSFHCLISLRSKKRESRFLFCREIRKIHLILFG